MPLIRTLLMEAARRVASDPEMRAKATGFARDTAMPAARKAAREAGETVRRHRSELDKEIETAQSEAGEGATRAEIAGRVTRKLANRLKGESGKE
ncbi:MAG: hypothetical protein ACMVY4_07435 [Minwuia sp.]|uniref:hypothetical protein n=1 Tax=Minwuia sp. TaxID=2493630 RepID=UPI003A8957B9